MNRQQLEHVLQVRGKHAPARSSTQISVSMPDELAAAVHSG